MQAPISPSSTVSSIMNYPSAGKFMRVEDIFYGERKSTLRKPSNQLDCWDCFRDRGTRPPRRLHLDRNSRFSPLHPPRLLHHHQSLPLTTASFYLQHRHCQHHQPHYLLHRPDLMDPSLCHRCPPPLHCSLRPGMLLANPPEHLSPASAA
ncbi:Protein of unknown function [Cotesia congregata]|uniref:Uncharacterized protein n=1 Tax=Cotesia congregata TaxID=51543 RepID=A0A8J2H691_COTCN|nr:Protein of unknown function [Cotesia congregata]